MLLIEFGRLGGPKLECVWMASIRMDYFWEPAMKRFFWTRGLVGPSEDEMGVSGGTVTIRYFW